MFTACFSTNRVGSLALVATTARPSASNATPPHCIGANLLSSSTTEKKAVVNSFIWYSNWKTAGSRLDAATYCKLFWTA